MVLMFVKYVLTLVGNRLPLSVLVEVQAAVNYLRIGRWMRDREYDFSKRVRSKREVWEAILDRVRDRRVLYLEFGVAEGSSLKYWSRQLKHPDSILHGFDSFEGLPEAAGPWMKGQFSSGGQPPQISDPRVTFFKGWFDRTLPTYTLPPHDVLVINMDADLYSSTTFVLRHLQPFIEKGTFIYFDEMNHVDHEPRAFDEFLSETGFNFRPVAADRTLAYVAFECLGR